MITNYDGTVYETPKVTYEVYMDMYYWGNYIKNGQWITVSGMDDITYNGEKQTPKLVITNTFFKNAGEVLVPE